MIRDFLKNLKEPLNDVSTNLENPPQYQQIPHQTGRSLEKYAYIEKFRKLTKERYPNLTTVKLPDSQNSIDDDKVRSLIEAIGESFNWKFYDFKLDQLQVEGTATTPFMRYKDDFVIRWNRSAGQISFDMRSKSRVGREDFGKNTERIELFFKTLQSIWPE